MQQSRRQILQSIAAAPLITWPWEPAEEDTTHPVAIDAQTERESYDPNDYGVFIAYDGTLSRSIDGEWQTIRSTGPTPAYAGSRIDESGRWRGPTVHPGVALLDLPAPGIAGRELWDSSRRVPIYDREDKWQSPQFAGNAKTAPQSVANTATETTVFTANLPADSLNIGQVYEFRLMGDYTTNDGTDTFTLRWYVGGTEITATTSVASQVTDAPIDMSFRFTVDETGANGEVSSFLSARFDDQHNDSNTLSAVLDTTQTTTVKATVQWTVAEAGDVVDIGQAWSEQKV